MLSCPCAGEQLVLLSSILSIQLAQGKTPEQIAALGALLTSVGDQLSLLSAAKTACENQQNKSKDSVCAC